MGNTSDSQAKPVFGPYSPVRQVGDLYFISGQVGVDPRTKSAPAAIAEQTRQALSNLKEALASHGLGLDNVVKTTVFLADMANFSAVNDVYVTYFDEPRPARSTVAVKELPRVGGSVPIMIEIEAIASRQA